LKVWQAKVFKSRKNRNNKITTDGESQQEPGNSPPNTPNPLQGTALVNQRLVQLHIKVDALSRRLAQLTDQRIAHRPPLGVVDKGTQLLLAQRFREQAAAGTVLPLADVEFSNYSQTGEDGILLYIFSLIGMGARRAVEICAGDGTECNSANLIIHHGWTALLVDGDADNVKRGKAFYASIPVTRIRGPRFINAWLEPSTINNLLRDHGISGEVDLLTVDIDGMDYWLWEAISEISPRVVVVEINVAMRDSAVTVPYSPGFLPSWVPLAPIAEPSSDEPWDHHHDFFSSMTVYAGASLPAFVKLARRKGYRLIGCNGIGHNAFFLREDVGRDYFPERDAEDCRSSAADDYVALARPALEGFHWEPV
jgi:hypothetical protein